MARFLDAFRLLIGDSVDILFGNADELCLLYGTDDVEAAVEEAEQRCDLVVVTLGADGALASSGGWRVRVPAEPVERVVDTTGAGDLFAAGFLHGLTTGRDVELCARLGAVAAAECISHAGARPEADLRLLAAGVR